MDYRAKLKAIRTNVMHLINDVEDLEKRVEADPPVTPVIKKATRGKGGRFVKKS